MREADCAIGAGHTGRRVAPPMRPDSQRCVVLHVRSPRGLSPVGVGPVVFAGQVALLLVGIGVTVGWPTVASIPDPPWLRVAGAVWIALGVALWGLTIRVFLAGFPRGELIVRGPYRYCRHPLYACLIVFVVPGVAVVVGSWPILAAAILGAVFAYPWTRREERELERSFGEEWRRYRGRTSWLLPLPPRAGHRHRGPPRSRSAASATRATASPEG